MSADPGSLHKALFDQDDGPDGIVLAGWGLTAVLAFVFAYSAWQYGEASIPGLIRLPPAGEVEITGSAGNGNPRVGTFGGQSQPTSDQFAPEITTIEIDVLRREVSDLRRTVATLRELNDRIQIRLDRLEAAGSDVSGSIGGRTPNSVKAPTSSTPAQKSVDPESNVAVKTRPMDPERDLPPPTAPGKADLQSAEPRLLPNSVKTVAAVPSDSAPRKPARVRVVTPGPASRQTADRRATGTGKPDTPTPIVMRKTHASSTEPQRFDDPIITGSIQATAPRALIPPSKPDPSPVVLPASTPPPGAMPGAIEPAASAMLSKSTFGVDLGGFRSFKELESAWTNFAASNAAASNGLIPLASMGENGGTLEVRLIAGPFGNAAHAMKLCAGLAAAGVACQPSLYSGQPFKEP